MILSLADVIENILFIVTAFVYTAIIAFMFFKKKKVNTLENIVYGICLVTILLQLLMNTLNFFMGVPFWSLVTKKAYNVFFIIWGSELTLFFFIVASKENQGYIAFKDNPKKDYFMKRIKIFSIVTAILCSLVVILPQYGDEEGLYYTSSGPSPTYCYIVFILFIISWFVMFFTVKEPEKKKQFIPIGVFVLLGVFGAILQLFFPNLYITNFITSVATGIIFFTIGNPDLNLIEELNMTKDSADRANKAKSDFLSSMSHEIRTPLNAIVGFSEALSEEEMSDENKQEVGIITTSAINLLEIVNGILDISKMDANKLEITNKQYILNNLINESLITAKRFLEDKKIEFKVDVSDKLPQVLNGDIVKIKNILTNLLVNSVKYTEEGIISLSVDGIVKENTCRLFIIIEDTGKGIDEKALPNLFTSYQLGDKSGEFDGSGLGVAVTKRLVELMGGKIHVRSKVGVGTSFIIALEQETIAKTSNEVEGIFAEELQLFDASGKKVLVVDDNGVNLKVAKRLLKDYNMDVDRAESGKECLEKINSGESYNLIMMDDFMPEMDGAQTLSNLKLIDGFNTPVIALTANNESGSKDKYMGLGFNNYLSKPISKEELNKILKEFLS